MAKFGDLINNRKLVLIQFHNQDGDTQAKVISEAFSDDDCKVVTIDVLKNEELSGLLRVQSTPHYMLYKEGQLTARFDNTVELSELTEAINNRV